MILVMGGSGLATVMALVLATATIGGCSRTDEAGPPAAADIPESLAMSTRPAVLPEASTTGAPFQACLVDYRSVDWTDEPEAIAEAHATASTPPCTTTEWYRDTAYQNGVLTFMVLVGQSALAEADSTVDGLRAQGFDRLATSEIGGSGRCEDGEIQAAIFTLLDPRPEPAAIAPSSTAGLGEILRSAAAAGAMVERHRGYTLIEGGQAPCKAAIVHGGRFVGWISSSERTALEITLAAIDLPPDADELLVVADVRKS